MKISIFVPIKLNSQRLPNKMRLPIGKKLLCQHIFDTLLEVKKSINVNIYCFCSDDEIKKYLPGEIIFLRRNKSVDTNKTKGIDIYKSFVNLVDADVYGLVHATSPFIKANSIITGLQKVINENYDSSFSVSEIKTFCWYNNKPLNYNLKNIVRTQEINPIYWETSAFYIFKRNVILDHNRRIGFNPFMVETDRIESIDIDTREDFDLAIKILN